MKIFGFWMMMGAFLIGVNVVGCDTYSNDSKPKNTEAASGIPVPVAETPSDGAVKASDTGTALDKPTPKPPGGTVSPESIEDQIPIEAVPYKPDASKKKRG